MKILCENCDHRERCDHCFNHNQLKLVNGDISYIEGEIGEVEWEVDTWAYTITGNKEAEELSYELTDIMMKYATPEEKARLSDEFLNELWRKCLERGFDEIVEWTINKNSRLAFQVLGEEIMFSEAKMPEDIKELILIHSEWKDEQDQLEGEKDQAERKYYLFDFREKIKSYKQGNAIMIHRITKREVFEEQIRDDNKLFIIDRKPIDYRIMNK